MEAQRPNAMRESTAGRGIEKARVAIGPMAGLRWLLRGRAFAWPRSSRCCPNDSASAAEPTRPRSAVQPERTMTISVAQLQPLVALVAGVLILLVPRILNYIVAIYLIIFGIIGLGLVR
jgi:hypothetical protein